MSKLKNMTGGYVILAYFLIYYLLPALGQNVFFSEIFSIYTRLPLDWAGIIFPTITFILFFIIYLKVKNGRLVNISYLWGRLCYKFINFYKSNRKGIVFFYCLFVVYINVQGLHFNNIRYSSIGIGQIGGLSAAYVFVKTLVTFDMLLIFISLVLKKHNTILKGGVANIIVVILYFLMLGGTADVILGLAVIGLLFANRLSRWLISTSNNGVIEKIRKPFFVFIFLLPMLILILFIGESFKRGFSVFDGSIIIFFDQYGGLDKFFYYLIESFSSALHSFNFALSREGIVPNENHFAHLYDAFQYRATTVLNFLGANISNERPEFSSMSQYNFWTLTENWNDLRQGTSAGVFASFIYLLGIPLGLLFSALYMVWIARVIDWVMLPSDNHEYFNLLGIFTLLIFFLGFLQSPIDLLNVLDSASIYSILILILASYEKYNFMRGV